MIPPDEPSGSPSPVRQHLGMHDVYPYHTHPVRSEAVNLGSKMPANKTSHFFGIPTSCCCSKAYIDLIIYIWTRGWCGCELFFLLFVLHPTDWLGEAVKSEQYVKMECLFCDFLFNLDFQRTRFCLSIWALPFDVHGNELRIGVCLLSWLGLCILSSAWKVSGVNFSNSTYRLTAV